MKGGHSRWMALWQQRPWRGLLGIVLTAGLSGVAVGLFTGLWIQFGARRRRRGVLGAPRSTVVELDMPAAAGEPPSAGLQADFASAAAWVAAAADLTNTEKLALYGCYKQATAGDCPAKQPWGMEASMKWQAWREHLGTPRAEAMLRYVAALDRTAPSWRTGPRGAAPGGRGGPKEGSGMSTGPAVSLLGCIGDPDQQGQVDETPVGQLCEKIADGDVEGARAVLRQAPGLALQADKDGMTPLHWACDRGCEEVARALLDMLSGRPDAAAHLNARDASGDTPLHFAVLTENQEIAKMLLACRADPDVKNNEDESPRQVGGEEWRELLSSAA